jgi:hypothetical protein
MNYLKYLWLIFNNGNSFTIINNLMMINKCFNELIIDKSCSVNENTTRLDCGYLNEFLKIKLISKVFEYLECSFLYFQ